MIDFIRDIKKGVVITALLSIILGIVLIIFPEITGDIICYSLGAIAIIGGFINVIRYFTNKEAGVVFSYDLAIGLILCGIGLFMIIRADLIKEAIPYVFGLLIIIDGFVNVQRAFDLNRLRYQYWWISLIVSVLSVGLGILVLFNPFATAILTIIVIGICLIYNGIVDLYIVFSMGYIKRKLEKMAQDGTLVVTAEEVSDNQN